jgi:L-amino acid N-acyltransferase YncA
LYNANDINTRNKERRKTAMDLIIRPYRQDDLSEMTDIWNDVVNDGMAFPQIESLTLEDAKTFFAGQYSAVAEEDGKVVGLYILHPNNIGRAGHIANASYAVSKDCRGHQVGYALVSDCLHQARKQGYRILQFNAVVQSNVHAYDLYTRLGFTDLGVIPGGFLDKKGVYEDIHVMYRSLLDLD